jgi:hypothetical protein
VAGFAEGFEGFQDFFDALDAAVGGAAEGSGDILGGGAGGKLGERVVDGAGLLGAEYGLAGLVERDGFDGRRVRHSLPCGC